MKGRFRSEQVQVSALGTPCRLRVGTAVPLPVQEEYLVQTLKVVGYCLFAGDLLASAQATLRAIHSRAELDLMPRALMMSNALTHKFLSSSSSSSLSSPSSSSSSSALSP